MADDALEAMLKSRRGFTVAPAGCGKTQLLASFVALEASGRQLVLTHTHAGVAAITKRLRTFGVSPSKCRVETIAGWCLRYAASYRELSGLDDDAMPDWATVYPAATRVVRSDLGKRILTESYDGIFVDEYQDCTLAQHETIRTAADELPCRAVGDLLQSVFGFKNDPCVTVDDIEGTFEMLPPLAEPWRWRGEGCNMELGEWLLEARAKMESGSSLEIGEDAPVDWVPYAGEESCAAAVWNTARKGGSAVAIRKWRPQCIALGKRLGGHWPVVERFDDPDLFACAGELASGDGQRAVAGLIQFLSQRLTGISSDLRGLHKAISAGKSTRRFSKHLDHRDRLEALANNPTPMTALAVLEGALNHSDWRLYRDESVFQLRSALQDAADGKSLADLPDAAAAARTRARHRGRRQHFRSIGTPLLVKGLEFDHAVVLWDPDHFSREGLYVAITRASKSLTIVSRSRVLHFDTN